MTDDLDGLLGTLHRAGSGIVTREVKAVVKKTAVEVKKGWRANATTSSGKAAPRYPYAIGFDDVVTSGHEVSVEIGPDKNLPQGALGNLLEFGSSNSAPHLDGMRAVEAETAAFVDHLADIAEAQVASTTHWGAGG